MADTPTLTPAAVAVAAARIGAVLFVAALFTAHAGTVAGAEAIHQFHGLPQAGRRRAHRRACVVAMVDAAGGLARRRTVGCRRRSSVARASR